MPDEEKITIAPVPASARASVGNPTVWLSDNFTQGKIWGQGTFS
jgi:hypothetical protein